MVSSSWSPSTTFKAFLSVVAPPEKTPKLEDIRENVAREWKLVKARELAAENAKEMAQKATAQGGTLSEIFSQTDDGPQVTDSEPFAWFTGGDASSTGAEPLRLSGVDGVAGAGPEFMEKVFSLEPGDVDSAMNYSQSEVYVIRLAEHEKSLRERHAEFMRSSTWSSQSVGLYRLLRNNRIRSSFAALVANLQKDRGLEYDPDGLEE